MALDSSQRNQLNTQLRMQPWYQQWFLSKGLNPNQVHLNDQQRQELAHVAAQNGMPVPHGLMIDPAGNINDHHGWAGLPTWGKVAIGSGLALTGLGLAGMGPLGGTLGLGGSVAPTAPGALAGGALTDVAATPISAMPAGLGLPAAGAGAGAGAGTVASVGAGATKAGSMIQKLLNPQGLADASSVLGGIGEAEANNRYRKGNLTQNYDRLMMEAQQDRRANETDAMRKLAMTGYIGQGGSHFTPPTIELNGRQRTAPSFPGIAPTPISDAQKQAAATLEQQMLQRVQPGGSYTPTDLSSYADRGALEKVGSYGGMALGGLGAFLDMFGGKIPGLPDPNKKTTPPFVSYGNTPPYV